MSRIVYNEIDDLDSLLSAGRWEGRVKAVLNGKPAQKSFLELEAALLAMPNKRLAADFVCTAEGDVCAIGAYALYKGVELEQLKVAWPSFDGDRDYDAEDVMPWAVRTLGITETLAWLIQEANDELYGTPISPERRYELMLEWTRKHIRR